MPIINKVPNKKIAINLQGAISIPNTDTNILLIGHRSGVVSSAIPSYSELQPKADYPQLTAYKSYDLPAFESGDTAMWCMQNLGFTVNYGLSNNLLFPAPDKVITSDPSPVATLPQNKARVKRRPLQFTAAGGDLASSDSVTLQWNSTPAEFDLLVGNSKEITITQVNDDSGGSVIASGTVQAVNQSPCQLVLNNVYGTFTTKAQIKVNYIDSSAKVPDPARTDEICMMVYAAQNKLHVSTY